MIDLPKFPKVDPDPSKCEVCKTEKAVYVPHNNCLYPPGTMGHSGFHCTANACY